jgi:hypothetical protein
MAFYKLIDQPNDLALNARYIRQYKNYYKEDTDTYHIDITCDTLIYKQVFNSKDEYDRSLANLTNALSSSTIISDSKYATWNR